MSVSLLVLGLFLFVMLVVVHEAGHFIVARRNGVEVEEFGLFFPPKLWSRKTKKGWILSLNLIPLGGFVRLKGEHDSDTNQGSYGVAKLGVKVKILLAGVGMNLLAAFVLFTILAWIGLPQLINNQYTVKSDTKIVKSEVLVGSVQPGSPAAAIGLKYSDSLTAIGLTASSLQPITSASNLPKLTKSFAGQSVKLEYVRSKQTRLVSLQLLSAQTVDASQNTKNPKGYLGVSPTSYTLQRSTWSAPIVAIGLIGQLTALTFHGLGTALSGLGSIIAGAVTNNHIARQAGQALASDQVTGPVGIYAILKSGSLLGYQFVLMIVAVISLTLAIMNVLPIPVLDGGKLFVTLVARALRKKLTEKVEAIIYGTSLIVILALVVVITIVDVKRFF